MVGPHRAALNSVGLLTGPAGLDCSPPSTPQVSGASLLVIVRILQFFLLRKSLRAGTIMGNH
jgi:hypothetical protein